jgi:uncharacterized protein YndB with AHSA1/START domain
MSRVATWPAVRIEKLFAAAPETLFEAWLDPRLVCRWMAPGSVTAKAEIEPRLGGHYRVAHSATGQRVGGFDATIVEMDRPNRLVFDWGMVGPPGETARRFDSRLTVTFEPTPSGTKLILVHERFDDFATALPEIANKIEAGWSDVLDKLAEIVG